MKKVVSVILSVILIFVMFGCKQEVDTTLEKDKNTIAASTPTPTQTPESGKNSTWYKKIKTNVWGPFDVVETDSSYFYCATDGVYEYVKGGNEIRQIISDEAHGLLLYDNDLYVNLYDSIKKIDLDTRMISNVWDVSMLDNKNIIYDHIFGFEIHDSYLYIWSLANSIFRVNLEDGTAEPFLENAYPVVFRENDCLYIDHHATNTFSVYSVDYITKEQRLIRGDGKNSTENKTVYIDDLLKVGEDVFYSDRPTGKIYKLNDNGEDQIVVSVDTSANTDALNYVDFIYSCSEEELYYKVSNKEGYKLYRYNSNGEDLFIDEFKKDVRIIAITESSVIYGDDNTVDCKIISSSKDKNTVAASTPTQTTTTEKYTLVVQGQDITQGNYVNFCENPKYVALPFTAVMKALGAKIQQKSENIIELNFNSETFVLDTKAVTLVKAESSTNFIIPAPGSKVYYKIVENEFVIDDITFDTIAMMMGVKLKVDINYQQHIVEIDYANEEGFEDIADFLSKAMQ